MVAGDGSFTIDNVPPGQWTLMLGGADDHNRKGYKETKERVCDVELQAGESAFFDLNADVFAPSTNADVAPGPARLQLRPFVRMLTPPDPNRNGFPPDPCRATMEVFDNTSGRTSIFAEFTTPPDPNRGGAQ